MAAVGKKLPPAGPPWLHRRRRRPASPRLRAATRAGRPARAAAPPRQRGPPPPALHRLGSSAAARPAAGRPAAWRRRGLRAGGVVAAGGAVCGAGLVGGRGMQGSSSSSSRAMTAAPCCCPPTWRVVGAQSRAARSQRLHVETGQSCCRLKHSLRMRGWVVGWVVESGVAPAVHCAPVCTKRNPRRPAASLAPAGPCSSVCNPSPAFPRHLRDLFVAGGPHSKPQRAQQRLEHGRRQARHALGIHLQRRRRARGGQGGELMAKRARHAAKACPGRHSGRAPERACHIPPACGRAA